MTAADHANTVRKYRPRSFGDLEFDAALDALEAQAGAWQQAADAEWKAKMLTLERAEAAEAERDRLLNAYGEADQYAKMLEAERDRLADALRLARSIILSGEGFTSRSRKVIDAALAETEHTT